jgi:hypothetical protein
MPPLQSDLPRTPETANATQSKQSLGFLSKLKVSLRYMFKKSPVTVILVILLIIMGGVAVYFYQKANTTKDPQAQALKELQATVKQVSRLMVLPTDEQPTLATVSDPDKLRDQAFFAKAQKGDKVLLYSKSGKAILYSVKQDKILEVSPFNVNNAPAGN